MQKKYPEHIDELEKFYKDQLGDAEVTPPENLWDKISDNNNKNRWGLWYFFTKRNTFLLAVVLIGAVTATLLLNKNSDVEKNILIPENTPEVPVNNNPVIEKSDATENINTSKPVQIIPSEKNKTITPENTNVTSPVSAPENSNTVTAPSPITAPVTDSVSTPDNTPKQKVNFKDKYKQKYQDSTRQLFVPQK